MTQTTEKDAKAETWPKGISVITLFTENLEATKQFYGKVFGLPVIFEDDNSAVFKFSNMMINLLKTAAVDELIAPAKMAGNGAGARFVFTIDVENVDAMCAELAKRGVKLLNGPMNRPWGIRTASFFDPGGYIWEIAQPQ